MKRGIRISLFAFLCAGGNADRSGPDGKEKAAKMKMKEKLITKMKLP